MPGTFFDDPDTIDPDLPPPPPTDGERVPMGGTRTDYGHLFEHGTIPSPEWDIGWLELVAEAEKRRGFAICGAKRGKDDLRIQMDKGYLTEEQIREDPLTLVCKLAAGYKTDHSGEGRCMDHGGFVHRGTMTHAGRSMISHHKLGPRIEKYLEDDRILDIRQALGVIWAAADGLLEDSDDEMTDARAGQLTNMMSKVGTLTKQHDDIMVRKAISIEVPEFITWVEHFMETSIRYIQEGDGDVAGFIRDAGRFFETTVSLTIGPGARDSVAALGSGSDQ